MCRGVNFEHSQINLARELEKTEATNDIIEKEDGH